MLAEEQLHGVMECTLQDFKSQFCVNFLSCNSVVMLCFQQSLKKAGNPPNKLKRRKKQEGKRELPEMDMCC